MIISGKRGTQEYIGVDLRLEQFFLIYEFINLKFQKYPLYENYLFSNAYFLFPYKDNILFFQCFLLSCAAYSPRVLPENLKYSSMVLHIQRGVRLT